MNSSFSATSPRSPSYGGASSGWTASQARDASIDGIFRKYDISRIHILEKRTRNDARKTQNDLRTLIRDRYHDIMSTTTTLQEMERSTQRLIHNVQVLQQYTQMATTDDTIPASLPMTTRREIDSTTVVNILLSILPELVWQALDVRNTLQAAMLLLLLEELHSTSSSTITIQSITRLRLLVEEQTRQQLARHDIAIDELARLFYVLRLLDVYKTWDKAIGIYLDARRHLLDDMLDSHLWTSDTGKCIINVLAIVRDTWSYAISLPSYYNDSDTSTITKPLFASPSIIECISQLIRTIHDRLLFTVVCKKHDIDAIMYTLKEKWCSTQYWNKERFLLETIPRTTMLSIMKTWNDQVQAQLVALVSHALNETSDATRLVQARIDVLRWIDEPVSMTSWNQIRTFMSNDTISLWDDICRNSFKERFEAIAREMFNQVITQPDTFIRPLLNQLDNDKYTDLLTTHWTPLSLFSSVDTIRNACDMTIVGWTDELLEVVQQLKSTLVNIYKVYRPAIHPVDATTTTTSITGRNLRLLAWEQEDLAHFLNDQQEATLLEYAVGLEQLVKCITNQLDMNDKSLQHTALFIQLRFIGQLSNVLRNQQYSLIQSYLPDTNDNHDHDVNDTNNSTTKTSSSSLFSDKLLAVYNLAHQSWIQVQMDQFDHAITQYLDDIKRDSIEPTEGWIVINKKKLPSQVSWQLLASLSQIIHQLQSMSVDVVEPILSTISSTIIARLLDKLEIGLMIKVNKINNDDDVTRQSSRCILSMYTQYQLVFDTIFIVEKVLATSLSTSENHQVKERLDQQLACHAPLIYDEKPRSSLKLLYNSIDRYITKTASFYYPYTVSSSRDTTNEKTNPVRPIPSREPCQRFKLLSLSNQP